MDRKNLGAYKSMSISDAIYNNMLEEKKQAIREYTEKFSNPYRAAEQGFIDEVIQPRDTRFKLIQALEMAKNKSHSNPPKKHGNIPL